jgi:CubicO group peptidase (beta-lactamase class C family)
MKHVRFIRHTMLVVFFMFASPNIFPQTAPQQRDSRLAAANKRQQIDDILTRFTAFGFSGTVLVADKGKVLLYKGYGLADRQRQIPNTTATLFPFASIGKGFTAAAIYKLEAEGKLNTADPINKYLPNVPGYAARITLLHLLTHSSGISHEADNVPGGATPFEYVANVLRLPLQSEPGARYSYSNAGFGLLDIIVEQVTGVTFESYLRDSLLRPAGLFHTGWRPEFNSRLFARGYQDQYRDTRSEITFPGRFPGNGGLVGTPAELYKWSEMLYTNRVLPLIARRKLFTPAFDEYVNGWWTTRTKQGVEVQMSDGDFLGYSTLLARFPSRRLTIVMAINNDAGWRRLIYGALRDILLGEKYEPPPTVRKIDEAQLNHLSGRYELSSGATLEVRAANDSLLVAATGQEAVSALAGVDAAVNSQLIDRNKVTTEFVDNLKKGDFDWAKSITEFQTPEPFQRLRNFWSTMIAAKGQLKSLSVVSSPSRGGLMQTFIRFDLERGTEYWLLLWSEGKMRGWSIDVSAPTPTVFRATSPNEFASLDVPTGKITRIRFQENERELLIRATLGGQVLARRVN